MAIADSHSVGLIPVRPALQQGRPSFRKITTGITAVSGADAESFLRH
jgi:hypothetical protein